MTDQYDVVIRGGSIIDGTGAAPYCADIAIRQGVIAEIGTVAGRGAEEVDASGAIVTPGFVDIHTHYDGQVIWEERVSPSSSHGVTTVVMGNCGVGFAPCKAEDRQRLVELMEGVEDIPEIVMTTGLTWQWRSYPDYLDALDAAPHDINVASLLPHSPLRVFVMGERAGVGEQASEADRTEMARLAKEAMEAGALGFSSSRSLFHRSSKGDIIPTYDAAEDELVAIGRAIAETGRRVLQFATDFEGFTDVENGFALIENISRRSGLPLMFPVVQFHEKPEAWKDVLERIHAANGSGQATLKGHANPRGIGLIFGLELTMHPFALCPSYQAINHLPLAERLDILRQPGMRDRLLAEPPSDAAAPMLGYAREYGQMFKMDNADLYERPYADSVAAEAERHAVSPAALVYDYLVEGDGTNKLYSPFVNYADGNLDAVKTIMMDEDVNLGLGDGGAHYGMVCDAGYPTFVLTHWTRDRTRGERISLPQAVKAMTRDTAHVVGLHDRGTIAAGYRADINVIDYEGLRLNPPEVVYDLPGGKRRLTQSAEGYRATIVDGKAIFRNGVATGALPGRLVRGPQPAPTTG